MQNIIRYLKEDKMGSDKHEADSKLAKMIKKAIFDCELTSSEHEAILALASEDSVVTKEEQALLQQLQNLLANQTIKRVKG